MTENKEEEKKKREKPEIKIIFVGTKETEKEFWDYYINLCIEEFLRRVNEKAKKELERSEGPNSLSAKEEKNSNERKIKKIKDKIEKYEQELSELLIRYPVAQNSEKPKLKTRIKNVKWAINKNKKILEKIEGSKVGIEKDL